MTPNAILMYAAGFGTRMRPLTDAMPKPLIPVAGRPLLDHARAVVAGHGPLREVVNAHYLADRLVTHLAGTGVAVSVETPDVLETGGGLKRALPLLGGGPVFTLNTDAVWKGPNPLTQLARAWDPDRMDALLLAVPLDRARGRAAPGDLRIARDGQVIWGGPLVYTGAQIIATQAVADRPETVFSLHRVWAGMQERGRLHAVVHSGEWCDVGRPENIAVAEDMMRDV